MGNFNSGSTKPPLKLGMDEEWHFKQNHEGDYLSMCYSQKYHISNMNRCLLSDVCVHYHKWYL